MMRHTVGVNKEKSSWVSRASSVCLLLAIRCPRSPSVLVLPSPRWHGRLLAHQRPVTWLPPPNKCYSSCIFNLLSDAIILYTPCSLILMQLLLFIVGLFFTLLYYFIRTPPPPVSPPVHVRVRSCRVQSNRRFSTLTLLKANRSRL